MSEGLVRIGKRTPFFLSVFIPPLNEGQWSAYHKEEFPAVQEKRDEAGFVRAAVYDMATFGNTDYRAEREFGKYVANRSARIDYVLTSEVVINTAELTSATRPTDKL